MLIITYAPVPTPALHCIPPYRVRHPTNAQGYTLRRLHFAKKLV
nr:MAG TPA: hypothetical protein [Caudoviricetes sp.]